MKSESNYTNCQIDFLDVYWLCLALIITHYLDLNITAQINS